MKRRVGPVQFQSAEEVAASIPNGATILLSGNGEMLVPDDILEAVEKRFLMSGEPHGLTLLYNVFPGGKRSGTGVERFAHPGMLKRVYAGSYYSLHARGLSDLVSQNAIEAYLLPYGHLYGMLRATAADQPGTLTRVGVGTFVDPRNGGGRLTERTDEEVLSIMEIGGEAFIFLPALEIDMALIRATTVDANGNLWAEQEPNTMGLLTMAMATSASGGRVIAQVLQRTESGHRHSREVSVPGIFVDTAVLAPGQMSHFPYDPALTGDLQTPPSNRPARATHQEIVARRAALELRHGQLANVGMGLAASVPSTAVELGLADGVLFNTEHGPIGGIPNERECFGPAINASAFLDSVHIFEMFAAGRLDITFLGMGEIDAGGSVNVSLLNGKNNLGGFLDIVHATGTIVFCGTFTTGGLATRQDDGRLVIAREGTVQKFVENLGHRSFDAELARTKGQRVLYVTERAVFSLEDDGLVLVEIAPGADLQRDVLQQMAFQPPISRDLRLMPARVFEGA